MERENSATWKRCNMEKVQHEKSAIWKMCNMEKVQHEKSATWKKCDMEKIEVQPELRENQRWRGLKQCLTALLIIAAKVFILDACGAPGFTSKNSAK